MKATIESAAFAGAALLKAVPDADLHAVAHAVDIWAKAEVVATTASVAWLNGEGPTTDDFDAAISQQSTALMQSLVGLFGGPRAHKLHLRIADDGDPRGAPVLSVHWDGCESNLFAGGIGIFLEP